MANYVINSFYNSLLFALPLSLADRAHTMQEDADEQEREQADGGDAYPEKPPSPNGGGDDVHSEKAALLPRRARGPKDFEHPAVRHGQRPIWVPEDPLGLAKTEVASMHAEGIRASTRHARMDAKGNVGVDGQPPEDN